MLDFWAEPLAISGDIRHSCHRHLQHHPRRKLVSIPLATHEDLWLTVHLHALRKPCMEP